MSARVDHVLATFDPEELTLLGERLAAKSTRRELRLTMRDAAIREALPLMGRTSLDGCAVELERLLGRYLDGPRTPPPDDAPLLNRLLHRIVQMSNGTVPGWVQMSRIGRGHRTPLPS